MTLTKKILLPGALALVLVLSGRTYHPGQSFSYRHLSLQTGAQVAHAEEKQQYTCGMHPSIIQDEPGNCPICGMDLTPVKPGTTDANESPAAKPASKPSSSPPEERKGP